jgi:hypothetical protein
MKGAGNQRMLSHMLRGQAQEGRKGATHVRAPPKAQRVPPGPPPLIRTERCPPSHCREGNDVGQESTVTYKQLLDLVCQTANYLKSVGVKQGDDVTIYMPMIPELPATMVSLVEPWGAG